MKEKETCSAYRISMHQKQEYKLINVQLYFNCVKYARVATYHEGGAVLHLNFQSHKDDGKYVVPYSTETQLQFTGTNDSILRDMTSMRAFLAAIDKSKASITHLDFADLTPLLKNFLEIGENPTYSLSFVTNRIAGRWRYYLRDQEQHSVAVVFAKENSTVDEVKAIAIENVLLKDQIGWYTNQERKYEEISKAASAVSAELSSFSHLPEFYTLASITKDFEPEQESVTCASA